MNPGELSSLIVNVDRGQVASSIVVSAKPTTLPAKYPADATDLGRGRSEITITLKDDSKDKAGISGEKVTLVVTNGLLNRVEASGDILVGSGGDDVAATCAGAQACTLTTRVAAADPNTNDEIDTSVAVGTIAVTLQGSGRAGAGQLTVTYGDLVQTKDFVLSGDAKVLEAEAEQSSIEVGGDVFVVLTVTDSAGNPVAGVQPDPTAKASIVGPDEDATPVKFNQDVAKDVGKGTANDIPACGDKALVDGHGQDPDVAEQPAVPGGTNSAGKCVIQVAAPADDETTTASEAATRGNYTLNFRLSAADKADTASVEVEVAGAPSRIETDAPAYVDPLSETEITITVYDDEDVRAGETEIEVRKLEGGGIVEGKAAADDAVTSNGQAKFSFIAPSTEGTVTFVVDAGGSGGVRTTISLNIGTAMPDVVEPEIVVEPEVVEPEEPEVTEPEEPEVVEPEEPEVMVDPTLNPAAAGSVTLTSFSGGSVEQLKAALSECGSDVAAHATGDDGWVSYVPAAVIPAANAPFNAAFADGIPAGEILQITSCN